MDNRTGDAVQGDLRLVDGPTANEGRLEIFALDPNAGADERPQWGTVCDDRFTSWSRPRGGGPAEPNRASFVACRIVGYEGGEFVSGHDYLTQDSLEDTPIWLDDVRCLAGDPAHKAGDGDSPVSLLDCYHAGLARHNCAARRGRGGALHRHARRSREPGPGSDLRGGRHRRARHRAHLR